jgi:hypothetical protein
MIIQQIGWLPPKLFHNAAHARLRRTGCDRIRPLKLLWQFELSISRHPST